MRAALLIPTLALTLDVVGCRHVPPGYTLVPSGPRFVVQPPKPAPEIRIDHARRAARAGCDIQTTFADVHWKGRTADVLVHAQELYAQGEAVLSPMIRQRDAMYTDTLQSIHDFRSALFARVADGCLSGPERAALLKTITERAALQNMAGYILRFGTLAQEGFVELTEDFRLKVVSPAGRGYQIAYYSIARAPSDDRVRLMLASITRSDETRAAEPPFPAPENFQYIRVLFWTAHSSADHYATVLTAGDRKSLADATGTFLAAPDGSCRIALPRGVTCIPVPPDSAVNAEMRVTVNGVDTYVGIGGTVAEAIHQRTAPRSLEVRRMYRGRPAPVQFDPKRGDILQLVLLPGDAVIFPQR